MDKKFTLACTNDINLQWVDIASISRAFDPNYYNLKIKLSNGETITFYHDVLTTRDDFEELLKVLYQTLNERKASASKTKVLGKARR